jgi:hypothetical protein
MITSAYGLTATERVLPKLALDFTTASLDLRVTFTRTGNTATVVNSSGYVVGINADLPRFDYDPITLACKGLLIEESRTNLLTYSDDFRDTSAAGSTRPWVYITNSTISANVAGITSPDGTENADKLIGTTTANNQNHIIQQAYTTSAISYVFSVFVKAAERNWILLNDSLSGAQCFFDTSAGTVGTATSCTGSISNFGNGWYRCSIAFTGVAGASLGRIFIARTGSATTWIGNDIDGVYLFGAQLEAGAFATSYIPTEATALTRNADVASMTGTNFSDWYNQSEGTFVFNAVTSGTTTAYAVALDVLDAGGLGDPSLGIHIANATLTANGNFAVGFSYNGSWQNRSAQTPARPTLRVAYGYKANDFGLSLNAAAPTTSASGTVASTFTSMGIGSRAGTLSLNGTISKISYYNQKLITNEIQAISK